MHWTTQLAGDVSVVAARDTKALAGLRAALLGLDGPLKMVARDMAMVSRAGHTMAMSIRGASLASSGATRSVSGMSRATKQFEAGAISAGSKAVSEFKAVASAAATATTSVRSLSSATRSIRGGSGGRGGGRSGGFGGGMEESFMASATGYLAGYATIETAKRIVSAEVDAGRNIIEYAIDKTAQKQGVLANYRAYLGSDAAAEQTYGEVQRIADRSPYRHGAVSASFGNLLGAGFDKNKAKSLMLAAGDLVAGPNASTEGFEAVLRTLQRVSLVPSSLTNRTLDPLLKYAPSLTRGNLIAGLSRQTGVDTKQAERQIFGKPGERNSESIIQAIIGASLQKDLLYAGKATAGAAQEKAGRSSAPGAISTFLDRLDEGFRDVTDGSKKLTDSLNNMNDMTAVGTPLMNEFKASVGGVFDGIISPWIDEYKDSPQKMSATIKEAIHLFDELGSSISSLSANLKVVVDSILWIDKKIPNWMKRNVPSLVEEAGGQIAKHAFGVPDEKNFLFDLAGDRPEMEKERLRVAAAAHAYATGPYGRGPQYILPGNVQYDDQGNPMLAHAAGGVTTRPHVGMVGEAGPEAIIPLTSGRSLTALRKAFGGGRSVVIENVNIPVTVIMSGDTADMGGFESRLRQMLASMVPEALQSAMERLADQEAVA